MGLEEQSIEEKVKEWFAEFEAEDKRNDELRKEKKLKPEFDFVKSNYLSRYVLHCPKFYSLLHTDSEYAIKTLWEIKDFKRKLSKKGLMDVKTFATCKNCKGRNGDKACEWR